MIQRSYTLNGINREALDAALLETLGAAYGGFSAQQRSDAVQVAVFLASETKAAQITALDALMAAHDPTVLTDAQQAAQAQQQKLAAVRRDYKGMELDPALYASENVLIQSLARKIAWLEQEIAALQGG